MAAPTVSLYVPTPSASRMAPCPVHAAVDCGRINYSVVNGSHTWSAGSSGDTLNYQVNASNLDARETASGTFTATNNVSFSSNTSAFSRFEGMVIFPGVTVPANATITAATLELYISNTSTDDPNCDIYGEDVDDAADFDTTADIIGRTKTSASVSWVTTGVAGTYVSAPDISSIVQEIYDRNGSLSNVNVGIILAGKSDANFSAVASSYDNAPAQAAKLEIQYTVPIEYKLDTLLTSLTRSGASPSNITVRENESAMSAGTVGSLAAGEYGTSGGYLYVRLSDDTDPDSKADDYVDITFDVSLTGDSTEWQDAKVMWQIDSDAVDATYRYITDPRPGLGSKEIDLTGQSQVTCGNRPRGFNMGWICNAGTHTITCTVTNPSGDSTTTTADVTVNADTRTAYTVQASGGDYTDVATAISTIGASTNNVKLVVESGHTENVTAGIAITGDNWWITGGATRPVLTYSDATDTGSVDFLAFSGENYFCENIELAESAGTVFTDTLALLGFQGGGKCGAFFNCGTSGNGTTLGLKTAFGTNYCDGLLLQSCYTDYCYAYSFVPGGVGASGTHDHIVCIEGDFGGSETESTVRMLLYDDYTNILWTKCDGSSSASGKSALRWWASHFGHQYGCYITGGDNWLGANIDIGLVRTLNTLRIEACHGDGDPGSAGAIAGGKEAFEQVTACNNIVSSATDGYLKLGENYSWTGPSKDGFKLLHNTVDALDGATSTMFQTGWNTYGANRCAANVFAHEDRADMTGYALDTAIDVVDVVNNTWPTKTGTTWVTFGRVRETSTGTVDHNITDLAALNSETWASGNEEKNVVLDADYIPDSPTTVTTESGVYDDYYGNARASTSYAGAVIAANPSGGGSSRNLLLLGVG